MSFCLSYSTAHYVYTRQAQGIPLGLQISIIKGNSAEQNYLLRPQKLTDKELEKHGRKAARAGVVFQCGGHQKATFINNATQQRMMAKGT